MSCCLTRLILAASSQAIVDAAAAPLLSGASAERAAQVTAAFAAAKASLEAEAAAEIERDEAEARAHFVLGTCCRDYRYITFRANPSHHLIDVPLHCVRILLTI